MHSLIINSQGYDSIKIKKYISTPLSLYEGFDFSHYKVDDFIKLIKSFKNSKEKIIRENFANAMLVAHTQYANDTLERESLDFIFKIAQEKDLLKEFGFIRRNILKKNFTNEQRLKLGYYTKPENLLKIKGDYLFFLSHLQVDNIKETLQYLRKNHKCINNVISYTSKNQEINYDTLHLDVCLANLKVLSDTTVVERILKGDVKYNGINRDAERSINYLTMIRTPYAFQALIEHFLLPEDILHTIDDKMVRGRALSAMIMYLDNYPIKVGKWEEWFPDKLAIVEFASAKNLPELTSPQIYEKAKLWYSENKNNLQINMDKF